MFTAPFTTTWGPTDGASQPSTTRDKRASSLQRQFSVGDEYGDEAAAQVARILQVLVDAGFAKAARAEFSVFERILSGLCWLIERVVKREDARRGRVHWEVLFQRHDKMKPRLGLAQEVVRCVEALPFPCPVTIQPHQLLLQDFGDIGTVKRLVSWLVELLQDPEVAPHIDTIRSTKAYLSVVDLASGNAGASTPLKREVVHLQNVYQPRRRYQYTDATAWTDDSEDALIQRCLLEYGERVAIDPTQADGANSSTENTTGEVEVDAAADPITLLAQLATAASAISAAKKSSLQSLPTQPQARKTKRPSSSRTAFEAQYQRMVQQSLAEQSALLEQQRERETQLLQHLVTVADSSTTTAPVTEELASAQASLNSDELRLSSLEAARIALQHQRIELESHAATADSSIAAIQDELVHIEVQEQSDQAALPYLAQLRELVTRNEGIRTQKSEFKAQCKKQLGELQARIEQLRLQQQSELSNQDEEALRLQEIEQMHAQMATKHKELRLALASQTRALQQRLKQIDDVPTRIELVQYEKRFLELYDEVALTLDETRKYFCVYNTLKTTHEFLEKEIALLNSMHDNFDVAMGAKPATQAYFTQLDAIIHSVEVSVRKQQSLHADHHARVETLDSKYQLLLEKERAYVNAIREFQKECEKNEKLAARLDMYTQQLQTQQPQRSVVVVAAGVSGDDVVI